MASWRSLFFVALAIVAACNWDPSRPFDRESPQVKQAIGALDAGDATAAALTLEDYLSTGPCEQGNIGAKSDLLRRRPDGTFDLGLSLFDLGEAYGRRFGEEENDAGVDDETREKRKSEVDCARRLVRAIAEDESVPLELRAKARYLEGNLDFLNREYEEAVRAYDQAIGIVPGEWDASDPVGADAAWNRAIALRRIEDQKNKDAGADSAGEDASQDAAQDASQDAAKDSGSDAADSGQDSGDGGGGDAGKDGGADGSAGQDSGSGADAGTDAAQPPPENDQQDAATPPPPSTASQDDRVLDMLENAPTVQQEDARRHAARRKVRGMEDK